MDTTYRNRYVGNTLLSVVGRAEQVVDGTLNQPTVGLTLRTTKFQLRCDIVFCIGVHSLKESLPIKAPGVETHVGGQVLLGC